MPRSVLNVTVQSVGGTGMSSYATTTVVASTTPKSCTVYEVAPAAAGMSAPFTVSEAMRFPSAAVNSRDQSPFQTTVAVVAAASPSRIVIVTSGIDSNAATTATLA